MRAIKRLLQLAAAAAFAVGAWIVVYGYSEIQLKTVPLQFSLNQGSSLRSAARQMQAAGVLDTPWQFEILARVFGDASRIQAGNYELGGNIAPLALLRKITSGDRTEDQVTFVEGWTFGQLRAALDAHPAVKHDTRGLDENAVLARLEIPWPAGEGLFFPDTYYFASGTSDLAILRRAHRTMQSQLDTLWEKRTPGLPFADPYEALILASIVEKETGEPGDRALVAAVFVNRLRLGMKLQTDPTVIYGLGERFNGNLRKRDLLADSPYNTYVRAGLPPTPIAMPGLAALTAVLNPAATEALYFVARGDGTSHFSATLAEHDRAVTKYQKQGNHHR